MAYGGAPKRKNRRGHVWIVRGPLPTRVDRLDGAHRRARVERALARLYRVLGLRDAMDKKETTSEAYFAFHRGLITKHQARTLGCVIGADGWRQAR